MLASNGVTITERNVAVGGGELDIVGRRGSTRVVFEVRAITGQGDPVHAYDSVKAEQVERLAGLIQPPCDRIDLVAVALRSSGVEFTWLRGVG